MRSEHAGIETYADHICESRCDIKTFELSRAMNVSLWRSFRLTHLRMHHVTRTHDWVELLIVFIVATVNGGNHCCVLFFSPSKFIFDIIICSKLARRFISRLRWRRSLKVFQLVCIFSTVNLWIGETRSCRRLSFKWQPFYSVYFGHRTINKWKLLINFYLHFLKFLIETVFGTSVKHEK